MLRLVHPAPSGQDTRPPTPKGGKSPALYPTTDERRNIIRALKNAARAYGSWSCLADVMGISQTSLEKATNTRKRGSYGLAVALARATNVTVETVLSGKLTVTGRCHSCGSTMRERAAVAAGGAR